MWALPWTHGPLRSVHWSLLYLVASLSVQCGEPQVETNTKSEEPQVETNTKSEAAAKMTSRRPGSSLLALLLHLVLPGNLVTQDSAAVRQSPRYTITPEGGSTSIICSSGISQWGVYLVQTWPQNASVIYYEDSETPTVDKLFLTRISFSGSQQNLTITMHRLQPTDSGIYTCKVLMDSSSLLGSGTLVMVTDKLSHKTASGFYVALAVVCFLVRLCLGLTCALRRAQVQKLCLGQDRSSADTVVYEEMSCSRHNTLSIPNEYQSIQDPGACCRDAQSTSQQGTSQPTYANTQSSG
ncbi:PREDICTED: T-cell antigen CD7 [Chrysochloris asiatica]|uniref:T-cell antigen CD7 n=1 Tax=Chrysochloris asiatica TaxID=185453 RepID=A0A9B0TSM3_CHRAS|nr:PREDICTED: T-cell antigen CD7 [Chrysochloris asiatica]